MRGALLRVIVLSWPGMLVVPCKVLIGVGCCCCCRRRRPAHALSRSAARRSRQLGLLPLRRLAGSSRCASSSLWPQHFPQALRPGLEHTQRSWLLLWLLPQEKAQAAAKAKEEQARKAAEARAAAAEAARKKQVCVCVTCCLQQSAGERRREAVNGACSASDAAQA